MQLSTDMEENTWPQVCTLEAKDTNLFNVLFKKLGKEWQQNNIQKLTKKELVKLST